MPTTLSLQVMNYTTNGSRIALTTASLPRDPFFMGKAFKEVIRKPNIYKCGITLYK